MGEPKRCPRCDTHYHAAAIFCQRDGVRLVEAGEVLEPDPYIGTVLLDQFRIEEVVGAGGMGTVYRARQPSVGRDVAIKILHPELVKNPDAVRRFQREAKVSSGLDHPNLVRVFLFGQLQDQSLYIVMEYLRGRSLMELMRADGALGVGRSLHIASQICDGIGEAHAHGVVHRDVKPENIFIVPRGRDPDFAKVLDFGIARFLCGEQTVATQTGLIFGTARYISPEGAAGERTDARSDVYSIAVLTYQMLCGSTPFDAQSPVALLMKHIHEQAPDIRRKPGGQSVPPEVADVVMRALSKNPDARPAHAAELGAALRAAASSLGFELDVRFSAMPAHASTLAPRVSSQPTPTTGPLPQRTLQAAPSPFGGHSRAVPRLRRARRQVGPLATVLLAFVLGAGAVVGGAWLVGTQRETTATTPDLETLEARARSALSRGDLDSPPGNNVAEITGQMLRITPSHAAALALRQEAARRLRDEAAMVRAQGFLDEARSRYRRVLVLDPDDPTALRGLAELETMSSPPTQQIEAPGVRVVPEQPSVGETATFVATVPGGIAEGPAPEFQLEWAGRRYGAPLPATEDEASQSWLGTYTFRRAGTYGLLFVAPGTDVYVRSQVTVTRPANVRRPEPPSTTQHGTDSPTRAEPAVTIEQEGIDWRLPDSQLPRPQPDPVPTPTPPAPEQTPPAPPAPWTSGQIF